MRILFKKGLARLGLVRFDDRPEKRPVNNWIPTVVIVVPLLLTAGAIGFAIWLITKPSRQIAALEKRAAAGDPEAQKQLQRMQDMQQAMQRALQGGNDPERQRLMLAGRPGRATIVDVRPTGIEIGHGPVPTRLFEVDLTLDGDQGGKTITVREAISEIHMGRLLKGASVPVRVDPQNAANVVVLWDTQ